MIKIVKFSRIFPIIKKRLYAFGVVCDTRNFTWAVVLGHGLYLISHGAPVDIYRMGAGFN